MASVLAKMFPVVYRPSWLLTVTWSHNMYLRVAQSI